MIAAVVVVVCRDLSSVDAAPTLATPSSSRVGLQDCTAGDNDGDGYGAKFEKAIGYRNLSGDRLPGHSRSAKSIPSNERAATLE